MAVGQMIYILNEKNSQSKANRKLLRHSNVRVTFVPTPGSTQTLILILIVIYRTKSEEVCRCLHMLRSQGLAKQHAQFLQLVGKEKGANTMNAWLLSFCSYQPQP